MVCTSKWVSVALISLTSLLVSCGNSKNVPNFSELQEEWNNQNHPRQMRQNYNYNFSDLPLSGAIESIPWPDTYWPSSNGGLAARWNDPDQDDNWKYELLDEQKARSADKETLDKLSPAEKYDIFIGSFGYSFVKYERERNKPDDEGWFGLCHGWAPASYSFAEPKPITLVGPSGIAVPFGSSDIKGLLTFAQQHQRSSRSSVMLGERCNVDLDDGSDNSNRPECNDTNPGAFHIVLANQLGILKKSFVADVTRDLQVWNQPIYGFESKIISETEEIYPNAAPGTKKIISIETQMKYVVESGAQYEPLVKSPENFSYFSSRQYKYTIELDANGKILGGEWENADQGRPDFLWTQTPAPLTGYFAGLRTIYNASISGN